MSNLMARLEQARIAARLTQHQLAGKLGVSQGHYSKVVTARVPLGDSLRNNVEAWLKAQGTDVVGSNVTKRMQELASSIRHECNELMQLAGLLGGETPSDRA